MSDITERLRLLASEGPDSGLMSAGDLIAAADEIERLRAALRLAIEWDSHDSEGVPAVWLDDAREALGDKL